MITNNIELFYNNLDKLGAMLALDHGTKKIGVAISNPELTMALPLKTIDMNGLKSIKLLDELQKIILHYKIQAIVIGLPLALDGTDSPQSNIVQKFGLMISRTLKLPIFLQDERFSSRGADNLLKTTGMNRRQRNSLDDAVAASLILETCLMSIKRLKNSTIPD